MKKTLASIAFAMVLVVPSISFAQTVDAPATQADLVAQIASLKQELVVLMTQLVSSLQSQLNAQGTDIHAIKSNMDGAVNVAPNGAIADEISAARVRTGPAHAEADVSDGHNHLYLYYLSTDDVSFTAYEGSNLNGVLTRGSEVAPLAMPDTGCNKIFESTIQQCGQNVDFPYESGHFLIIDVVLNGNTTTKIVGDPTAMQ